MDKEQKDFLSPIYNLPISRVWRGFGAGFFIELGELSEDDKKGKYTLWIETNMWKLSVGDSVFDGNEEPYESIDKKIGTLVSKKLQNISLDQDNKKIVISFDDKTNLSCVPSYSFFVILVDNTKSIYMNFNVDGSISFDDGHKKPSGLPEGN